MDPERTYTQCCEATQMLLVALESGDMPLIEHQVKVLRDYLAPRDRWTHCLGGGDALLRAEQLDAIEAVTDRMESSLLAMRESARGAYEEMLGTESLLKHLTRPRISVDVSALPVC